MATFLNNPGKIGLMRMIAEDEVGLKDTLEDNIDKDYIKMRHEILHGSVGKLNIMNLNTKFRPLLGTADSGMDMFSLSGTGTR